MVKIETLPLYAGQVIRLAFERTNSPWRQGVSLATKGKMETNHETSPQFLLWSDTALQEVVITCLECDGLLRFYNIWDKRDGRGRGSLGHTSGMVVEDLGGDCRRYGCNNVGFNRDFQKLVSPSLSSKRTA